MSALLLQTTSSNLVGFLISVGVGHFITFNIIKCLREKYDFPKRSLGSAILLGILERFSFTVALLTHHENFIGFWLGIKMLSRWAPKGEVPESGLTPDQKLHAINIFLIGNLLNIIFSLLGAWVIGGWSV